MSKKYYHMSQERLPDGTVLKPRSGFHVDDRVEEILASRRPKTSLERSETVFLSETEDSSKHGLTYDWGYLHVVRNTDPIERRDSYWIGQLQLRHHAKEKLRKLRNRSLDALSDDDIADKYWSGIASEKPNWETTTKSAVIVGVVSEQPIPVRPTKSQLPK